MQLLSIDVVGDMTDCVFFYYLFAVKQLGVGWHERGRSPSLCVFSASLGYPEPSGAY